MTQMHARFVQGSIMKHVVQMTWTGSIGLVAIFAVDALNLYYISLLKNMTMTAALGFASSVIFAMNSVAIGLSIAGTALVSRSLGASKRDEARLIGGSSVVWSGLLVTLGVVAVMAFCGMLLSIIGATGEAHVMAKRYLLLMAPSIILSGMGMMYGGILRAVGDARRAMWTTLSGGFAAAILDPILILWLGLDLDGAAISSIAVRVMIFVIGYHGAVRVHDLARWPTLGRLLSDRAAIFTIAMPAVLTNVATPVGLAIGVAIFSRLGNEVVAGMTVTDRLVPLCFGVFFALTGAVGPIIGQNLGAGQFGRVHRVLSDSLIVIAVYACIMCGLLAFFAHDIANLFHAEGDARRFIIYFCHFGAIGFSFVGVMFVANTAFNNLGFPLYATFFNWSRALISNGVMPLLGFMMLPPHLRLEGAYGLSLLAGALISIVSALVCFRVVGKMRDSKERGHPPE